MDLVWTWEASGVLLISRSLDTRWEYSDKFIRSVVLKTSATMPLVFNPLEVKESAALEHLLERLRLILAEQAWTGKAGSESDAFEQPPDPWWFAIGFDSACPTPEKLLQWMLVMCQIWRWRCFVSGFHKVLNCTTKVTPQSCSLWAE